MFGDLFGAMILRIPKASSERYAPHATTGATALLLPAQTLLFMYVPVSIGTGGVFLPVPVPGMY